MKCFFLKKNNDKNDAKKINKFATKMTIKLFEYRSINLNYQNT